MHKSSPSKALFNILKTNIQTKISMKTMKIFAGNKKLTLRKTGIIGKKTKNTAVAIKS